MTKLNDFYGKVPTSEGAEWSDELAVNVFGAMLVGCIDSNIKEGIKRLEEPSGCSSAEAIRDNAILLSLTDAQRNAVSSLVKDIAQKILRSICVKMDQFPGADLDVTVVDPSGKRHCIIAPTEVEVKNRYFEWLEEFSDYNY